MKSLDELRELERRAAREWLGCLDVVGEMASMRAEDPDSGCLENFRAAQMRAQQAGLKRLALQIQIAELEGACLDQRSNFSTGSIAGTGTASQSEH